MSDADKVRPDAELHPDGGPVAADFHKRSSGQSQESILVEIAPGELIDKITILEIKSERIADAAKLCSVRAELAALSAARNRAVPLSAELSALAADLKAVNEKLWDIEDEIRRCERAADFGPRFIELARSVYQQNDRRAELKRHINDLLGSTIREEKAYVDYRTA